MTDDVFSCADAQALRRHWFAYLDTVADARTALHAYCLKLTRNLWDAEDLVQDTLLRGFGMTARGDFHGPLSPVRNMQAYLFRTATNLWLDRLRRGRWQVADPGEGATALPEPVAAAVDPAVTSDALNHAAALTSAREFVAILLKDVYAFSLEEIADFIGTSAGTVKSLLSRGRKKLHGRPEKTPVDPATAGLVRKLADAMNAGDVDGVLGLMSETVKIDVCNVGGGRGRRGVWTEKTLADRHFGYAEHDGSPVLLLFGDDAQLLTGAVRVEVEDGTVTRLVDYHYAPETLELLAGALDLTLRSHGYRQSSDALPGMIATTGLPWHGA